MIAYGKKYLNHIKIRLSAISIEKHTIPAESEFNIAAVLIPIALRNGELEVLFTKRSDQLRHHRGQISFPGGRMELRDCSLAETALRETHEEIGIKPELVEIIGSLQPYVSPSNYYIYPYVGFISDLNELQKNINEVEKIFCIPLSWLLEPSNSYQEDYQPSFGKAHKVWFFMRYEDEQVWGITAGITHQMLEIIN